MPNASFETFPKELETTLPARLPKNTGKETRQPKTRQNTAPHKKHHASEGRESHKETPRKCFN